MKLPILALITSLTLIVLPDGSSYTVDLLRTDGRTWVYQVERVAGKDLSHWVLGLGLCDSAVVATDPPATYGTDPTTGAIGWKFEPILDQSATYTLVLAAEYPATGIVTATMKAGALGNNARGVVTGPDCTQAPVPTGTDTPTVTPTASATATMTFTVLPSFTPTMTPTSTATLPLTPTATPTGAQNAGTTPTATATMNPTGIKDDPEPARQLWWLPLARR